MVTSAALDEFHHVAEPLEVVAEVDVTTSGLAGAAVTAATTYAYENPFTGEDTLGRYAFRGFETVRETGPAAASGAQLSEVRRYDYVIDKTGSLVEELTFDTGKLAKVKETSWTEVDTTNQVPSYQIAETDEFTCAGTAIAVSSDAAVSAADASCEAAGVVERHVTGWTQVSRPGTQTAIGWVAGLDRRTTALRKLGGVEAQSDSIVVGDRGDATTYETHYSATQWMVLPSDLSTTVATSSGTFSGGTSLQHVKHVRRDHECRHPGLLVRSDQDAAPGVVATTTYAYDAYGNVASTVRPNQFALGAQGKAQSQTYDPRGLRAVIQTDEMGHSVAQDWDFGLGLRTLVSAPQASAAPLTAAGVPDKTKLTAYATTAYDGFGRVTQRATLLSQAATPPELVRMPRRTGT